MRRLGPGVNFQRDGAERGADVLAALIEEVRAAVPEAALAGVVAGVAGAGRADEQAALAGCLRQRLGLAPEALVVEHDAAIALEAAFGGESGMIVVAGTGSVVLARTEAGALHRAGGWGPGIDDPGSGIALGRAALVAVAADFDGGTPTALRQRLAERYGIATPDDLIAHTYGAGWTMQDLAPLVIEAAEADDWVATRILTTQANALAQQARQLVARAPEPIAPRVALLGGLTGRPTYRACLSEAIRRHLPDREVAPLTRSPVEGALALACRAAGVAT